MSQNKKILVHTCCAPCSSYSFEELLHNNFDVTGYFHNPNIYPFEEYKRRKDEFLVFAQAKNYKVIVDEDPADIWFKAVEGYENEPERGKRCELCFKLRLEKTAQFAKAGGFDIFTTVLTISPHKNAKVINSIGNALSEEYDIKFLETDFKKNDGFRKSLEISKQYGLYRQNYCGCKFSIRP